MDLNKIKEYAKGYEKDMTAFLRAIVKNPGESCDEKAHVETIAAEMKKVGFDEGVIDPQGNVMGFMGTGDKIIAFDAHIVTVGIGNIDNWKFDPGLPALPDTYYRPWPHSHLLPISSGFR